MVEEGGSMKEFKFFIAGVQHHEYKKVVKVVMEGHELEMVPETSKRILKIDPNAVRLEWYDDVFEVSMIGYVPAKKSAEVSAFLFLAEDPICIITAFNPTAKPWEMFEVVIREREVEDE